MHFILTPIYIHTTNLGILNWNLFKFTIAVTKKVYKYLMRLTYQWKKLRKEKNVISINFLQLKLAPTFKKFGKSWKAISLFLELLYLQLSVISASFGVISFLLHFFEFLPQRSKRIIKVYCRRYVMTGSGLAELTVWISETFRHCTDFRSRNYTSIKSKYLIVLYEMLRYFLCIRYNY